MLNPEVEAEHDDKNLTGSAYHSDVGALAPALQEPQPGMRLFKPRSLYSGPERRIAKPSPALLCLVALGVAAIAFATLCPIGLRPHLASANEERFGAYFVLGLIVSQAAPRRSGLVLSFLVLLALGLEAAQTLIPGRDGRFADACVKATGGVVGAQLGFMSYAVCRWLQRHLAPFRPAVARIR